jgi:hypothetical protein
VIFGTVTAPADSRRRRAVNGWGRGCASACFPAMGDKAVTSGARLRGFARRGIGFCTGCFGVMGVATL